MFSSILARSQSDEDFSSRKLSRNMRSGIRLFKQGKDSEALDRFMEVLVHGEPSERAVANDYLNRITQRMNWAGGSEEGGGVSKSAEPRPLLGAPPAPSVSVESEPTVEEDISVPARPTRRETASSEFDDLTAEFSNLEKEPSPKAGSKKSPAQSNARRKEEESAASPVAEPASRAPIPPVPQRRPPAGPKVEVESEGDEDIVVAPPESRTVRSQGRSSAVPEAPGGQYAPGTAGKDVHPLPAAREAALRKQIRAAIQARAQGYLAELRKTPSVQVAMGGGAMPLGIAIPSGELFGNGVIFKKQAAQILRNMTGLIYHLGGAQVAIFPEGMEAGESKILDMRRVMGVSAHFYSTGVAPARIRVNLAPGQVDIPRELSGFHGILLVFMYDRALHLVADPEATEEAGPSLSLGVFPDRFRAGGSEGALIEFSVVEPPAGVESWKFQLLGQAARGSGSELIQEASGNGPAFHQIFWNGRLRYTGGELPPGRYQAVLAAVDKNRKSKTLRSWITLDASGSRSGIVNGLRSGDAPSSPSKRSHALRAARSPKPVFSKPLASAAKSRDNKNAARGRSLGRGKAKTSRRAEPQLPSPHKTAAVVARPGAQAGAVDRALSRGSAASGVRWGAAGAGGKQARTSPLVPKTESPAASAPEGASEGAVSYKISFDANTANITPEGQRQLSYVADAMTYYPQESLKLIGFAGVHEPDANGIADRRTRQVLSVLVEKYGIDSRRIQTQARVLEAARPEVAIYSYVRQ